ncbi:MAG: MATE family efflux transporter [Roseburia sp.]|nr:MATE family efflux transporter [Roseburia sp.]
MRKLKELFIGDKKFYRMVLLVAIPIIVQNSITNLVSLLDNIMVGRVGTEQMSGVAIVNQLIMVFNICIFGCVSAAGIFGAQFYGKGDHKGVKHAFRFKILCGLFLSVSWILVFYFFRNPLIHLFLHEGGGQAGDLETTYRYGSAYLIIMLFGLVPAALTQVYAGTLRETGETVLPMKAGVAAVLTNLILDYALIFGIGPIPSLGVEGAAIATVAARFLEAGITIAWTHRHKEKNKFIVGAFESMHIPGDLTLEIIKKGTPLLINETLWSLGTAMLNQCYSTRGLAVVAGLNISSTVSNLFNVVFIALGSSIAIVVGQLLGAGKLEEAVDTDRKMIFFSVASCFVIGMIMFAIAPLFPAIYNTSSDVRHLATRFIRISSACMPLYAFMHASYFTLRSGGKTWITFLFDSVYIWVFNIPLAFLLTRFTGMYVVYVFLCCQLIEIFKCMIGFVLIKKRVWVNDLV